MIQCPDCSREFKHQGHLTMHQRSKHPVVLQVEPMNVTPTIGTSTTSTTGTNTTVTSTIDTATTTVVPKEPFRFPKPPIGRLSPAGRSIKMVRPRCQTCQRAPGQVIDWWKTCTHNPYIGLREVHTPEPIYSEPDSQGRRTVLGVEDKVYWEAIPNLKSVDLNIRTNSGEGVERARRKGCILPEELRTPEFPNGIAQMCQYRGCESHDIRFHTAYGDYCREIEAKLVAADYLGHVLEVGHDTKTIEKRRRQIDAIKV